MDKHTPGPWQVQHAFNSDASPGEVEVDIRSDGGQMDRDGGAYFPARAFGEGAEQAAANARLIAAAPSMLDALREALVWCEQDAENEDGYPTQDMMDARAALLRAALKAAGVDA